MDSSRAGQGAGEPSGPSGRGTARRRYGRRTAGRIRLTVEFVSEKRLQPSESCLLLDTNRLDLGKLPRYDRQPTLGEVNRLAKSPDPVHRIGGARELITELGPQIVGLEQLPDLGKREPDNLTQPFDLVQALDVARVE